LQKRPIILRGLLIVATPYQILVLSISCYRALLAFHRALLALICYSISYQTGLFPYQNLVLCVTFHTALLAMIHPLFPIRQGSFPYGGATISRLLKIIGFFAEYRLFYKALLICNSISHQTGLSPYQNLVLYVTFHRGLFWL